ncbi:MAG: immunoglobulin domain-containing protein [Blastococcus sp.]|nr:immunoglobulin domain-containing protein [Blastococcus sp.]
MGAGPAGRPAWWAALAALAVVVLMAAPATLRADTGPVPTENAQPGTPGWWAPTAPQPSRADQWAGRVDSIDGWVWPLSAAPGEDLDLHVGTAAGVRYRVEFYRLGWYGGAGGRLMACLPDCGTDKAGIVQPLPPAPDPVTGEVSPDWSLTDEFTVPASWPSGFYMAALKVTSGNGTGSARRLPFVVRAPSSQNSRVVVIVPVNTWQAYNGWGGNALYDNHSADGQRASHVSFERPWMEGVEQSTWRYDELNLVRFLERNDVDVSYITDQDVSTDPGVLDGHNVVMTSGHDEYWTKEHFDALEDARDAGQNLAFMGANIGYWQVRYANGGRTMIGYKSLDDPIADPALKTARFRDTGRPECTLLGVQYMASGWPLGDSADLGVVDASLNDPWFAGTGFTPGATITDGLGYEWDQIVPGCATQPLTRLFQWQAPGWPVADSVRYTAPSGAKVFSAATLQFSWGLDGWRYNSVAAAADPRLEAFTRNMLTDMGGLGSGSTEPAVTVTPATATVATGATRQFAAALENASDGVEWSVDGTAGGDAVVGTISASGLYTAPAAVPAGGSVTVRATHLASGASDEAVVTVTTTAAPQITTQPAPQSVTAGGTATFTAAASGSPAPTVQWQVSEDAGATFTDISGATSPTLTMGGVTISKNQSRYRAVFTNTLSSATTSAAILTVTATGGAPANDAFAAAQVITGNTGTLTGTNLGATKETGEPTQAGNAGGASIWYSWTPAANGNVTFDTAGSSFDTTLGISTGTAVNALTLRASNDDVSSGVLTSRVTLTVTAGTTYRISVDGYNALKGAVTLNWNLTVAAGPPANDAFAAAQVLAGDSGTITGTNLAATKETGEPSHAGNAGGGSVWYSWTPTSSGSATIDTAGSAFDTTLAVYTGTAVNGLTARASNDDVSSGVLTSRVTLTVTAGTTYRISVDGYNALKGAVTLNWNLTVAAGPPANDAFAAAQVLAGDSGTITGTNLAATKETGEPSHAGNAGGGSVWYSWTPTSSGSATIDTAGSAFDTTLAVYTGTAVNALTARASNDDVSSGVLSSRVTLTVTAGTTYRIAVDGYGAARGAITLNWVR